ncbi:MAG TPA: L-histidine N(alpha)-methyltransferase [Mycobacteriales bacterium]|nr:L-histidine N(alpha)-methyltransferase [Mycobacteriales bacterium]
MTESLTLQSHLPPDFLEEALRADVTRGLTATPKTLPPKWFYDERGSVLFEQITRLEEYYPTRAEREILLARAAGIAAATGARTLVELGSGSGEKTRLLIEALRERGTLRTYVPMDVSPSALLESGRVLVNDYPGLLVHALLADFEHQLGVLPTGERRLTAFLGGTIGNLEPGPRAEFLAALRGSTQAGDWLLLGTDLVKDPAVLVPAYDDAAGVTARFNKNVLAVVNRELDADFDLDAFEHVARWDPDAEWIEMRLRSTAEQKVMVGALDLTVPFEAGEEMRTEVSAKFRPDGIRAELAAAGFAVRDGWTDAQGRFLVTLSEAV